MSKDKDESPKALGGRRRQKPASENSLKNLRPWQAGQSGNPLGKSRTVVEITRQARELVPDAIQRLYAIMNDPEAPHRDQIAAANAICDRGLGRPVVPVFQGGADGMSSSFETEDGTPATALLMAAKGRKDASIKAQLQAELRRIEAAEAQGDAEKEDQLAEARAAQARGEEIPGILALLLAAKDANDDPAPSPPAPRRIEAPRL